MILSQDGKVVYEETGPNGHPRGASDAKVVDLTKVIGTNVACHDVIPWGDDLGTLVVACMGKRTIDKETSIWLQFVDRKTFDLLELTKYNLTKDSDFRIFNRISLIEVYAKNDKGKNMPYLIVHDSGKNHYIEPSSERSTTRVNAKIEENNLFTPLMKYFFDEQPQEQMPEASNDVVRDNSHFLVFHVEGEKFAIVNEFYVTGGTKTKFSQVFDYFWTQDKFIVTSFNEGDKTHYYLNSCEFKVGNVEEVKASNAAVEVNCNDSTVSTGDTNGYVGQMIGSQLWVYIHYAKGKIDLEVFNTLNNVMEPSKWLSVNNIHSVKQPTDFAGKWVRGVQGNANHVVVKYTSIVGT